MAADSAPPAIQVGGIPDHRGVRERLQWFTREKQWVNEVHLELCRAGNAIALDGE
jgi:hypothetical protein